MTITFVSSTTQHDWSRLLALDGERCWQRAQRRRERAARSKPSPDAKPKS